MFGFFVKNHLYTSIRIKQSTQNIKFVFLKENNNDKKLLNTLMFVLTVLILLAQTATKENYYLMLTA